MIRILESKQVGRLFSRRAARLGEAEAVVRPILEAVRKRGDRALIEYERRFTKLSRDSNGAVLKRKTIRVSPKELEAAAFSLTPGFVLSLKRPSDNIRKFASMQMPVPRMQEIAPGLRLGQIVRPLDSVGAYIPGGRYPLPSTVMMTVVPAQVVGVKNISVACPS